MIDNSPHWLLVAFYRTMLGIVSIGFIVSMFFVFSYILFHFTGTIIIAGSLVVAWLLGSAIERIYLNRNL